jgi:hypothetical protein
MMRWEVHKFEARIVELKGGIHGRTIKTDGQKFVKERGDCE